MTNTIPYNTKFAEAVLGKEVNRDTKNYLKEKSDSFYEYKNSFKITSNPISYVGTHVYHVITTPIKVIGLIVQIAQDAIALLLNLGIASVYLGLNPIANTEVKARVYNLVIDTTLIATLPLSLLCSGIYKRVEGLHLGIGLYNKTPLLTN